MSDLNLFLFLLCNLKRLNHVPETHLVVWVHIVCAFGACLLLRPHASLCENALVIIFCIIQAIAWTRFCHVPATLTTCYTWGSPVSKLVTVASAMTLRAHLWLRRLIISQLESVHLVAQVSRRISQVVLHLLKNLRFKMWEHLVVSGLVRIIHSHALCPYCCLIDALL